MVEVLRGICQDPEARLHFSSSGKDRPISSGSASKLGEGGLMDFQALKEKLLEQVIAKCKKH